MSKPRAKKIKLLLLDVDGVMTDGKIFLVPTGGEAQIEVKGFNAHDGAAFSLARLGGLKTGIITKRISETVRLRARDLKIEHVYQGAADKLAAFHEILEKENLKPEQAAYVGDDIIDLPVMRVCGLAFAVANAREDVKDEAHVITDHRGGEGAVRDAIEYILKAQDSLARCVDAYISDHTPAEDKHQ
jgi:3-deoxy-D-manno-octulosonate 8-phosphate phosphatase (KDO 8-P phosphatase)